jgi:hypothetical protein
MLQGLPLRCCAGKLIGRATLRWDDPLRFAQMQARKVDLPQPVRYEELQREVMSELSLHPWGAARASRKLEAAASRERGGWGTVGLRRHACVMCCCSVTQARPV